jgi:hypothetical protein
MEFTDFAQAVKFTSAGELNKAQLIAYYLYKERGATDLALDDLLEIWQRIAVAQPNRTRLQRRMNVSGKFPRAPVPNKFRLHGDVVRALDKVHGRL